MASLTKKEFLFYIVTFCCIILLPNCAGKKYSPNDGEVVFSNSFDLTPDVRLLSAPVETLPVIDDLCFNVTDFDYQNAGISMDSYSKIEVQQYKKYFARNGKFDFYLHPIVCEGRVFDIKIDGEVVAYELNDGKVKKIWNTNTLTKKEQTNILLSQARLEEGILYISTGNGFVLAFNTDHRKVIWKRKFNTMFSASPTIHEDGLYLISSDDEVYAMDKNTGELLWKTNSGSQNTKRSFQVPPVAVFKERIVAGLSSGFVLVLDKNGKLLWKNRILSAKSAEDDITDIDFPPILFNNVLVAGGLRNGVIGFDFNSGQPLWQIPTGLNSYMLFNKQGFGFFVNDKNENICFAIQNGLIRWVKPQKSVIGEKISGYLNNGNAVAKTIINRYFDAY